MAITGPSDSGKSTLLHCLAGVLVPDSGVVSFRGTRLDSLGVDERTRLRRLSFGVVLQVDPRPAGRAAAVGAVGLTIGVLGVFVGGVLASVDTYDRDDYLVPAAVVAVCALLAVVMIALSIAVHSVETTAQHRREMAALVATGVSTSVLTAAQRTECLLTSLPLALAGSAAGSIGYGWLAAVSPGTYVGGAAALLLAALVVAGSVLVTTALVRPWLVAAVDPGNLRTA